MLLSPYVEQLPLLFPAGDQDGQVQQMRRRDREMVPRALVQAMFALMFASTAIVAYAQYTNRPNVGVPEVAAVTDARDIVLVGDRSGIYLVQDEGGATIAVPGSSV